MREAADLFSEFDRMLDVPRMRAAMSGRMGDETGPWGLALDVSESDDQYKVEASVPGVDPDDLNITLEDNVLTISGENRVESEVNEPTYHMRERRYGKFSRSLRFPAQVNADAVSANIHNGVLTLTVPKAEEVKPKRITIQAGNGSK
jgi:HSP20 family protein